TLSSWAAKWLSAKPPDSTSSRGTHTVRSVANPALSESAISRYFLLSLLVLSEGLWSAWTGRSAAIGGGAFSSRPIRARGSYPAGRTLGFLSCDAAQVFAGVSGPAHQIRLP